jgi:(p)ppGpp synthase/HD superfamily hydrolase
MTQKGKKPSRDWLAFVKTGIARKKIGAHTRRGRDIGAFAKKKEDTIEIRISAKDRVGLMKDITSVVANFKISMREITTESRNRLHPLIIILSFARP